MSATALSYVVPRTSKGTENVMVKMEDASDETRELMRQMVRSWANAQQQMIEQWLEMIERYDDRPSAALWSHTISVWESSVKRTMEAQNATLNAWMVQLQEMEDMPGEAQSRIEEGKAIVKRWAEAQNELWEKWFDTMRRMDPSKYESNWREMARRSASAWRDYAQKIQQRSEELTDVAEDASGATMPPEPQGDDRHRPEL